MEAHISNQGAINISAEIKEVGTTTHDEWYGDLRDTGPTLDEWYDHVKATKINKASNKETRQGVMDGTIPSAFVDSGATSNVVRNGDGLTLTSHPSNKVFKVCTGQEAKANETVTMEHNLHDPARTFDRVPDLTLNSLASTSKMSDAGYFSIFDEEEIRIYDARTTKVVTSKPPVLKGW